MEQEEEVVILHENYDDGMFDSVWRTDPKKKETNKKTIGHNASFRELLPEQFLTVLRVCIYTQRKRSKSDSNV